MLAHTNEPRESMRDKRENDREEERVRREKEREDDDVREIVGAK